MALRSAVKKLVFALSENGPHDVIDYQGIPHRTIIQQLKSGNAEQRSAIIASLEEDRTILKKQVFAVSWSEVLVRSSKQIYSQLFQHFNSH